MWILFWAHAQFSRLRIHLDQDKAVIENEWMNKYRYVFNFRCVEIAYKKILTAEHNPPIPPPPLTPPEI